MSVGGQIRWVRTPDGVHLASRVTGEGDLDLLEIGGWGTLFPLETADDQPRWRSFEDGLGRFSRLLRFDNRGIGSSELGSRPLSVDQWTDDAVAVLDAVGCERASVIASSFGALAAIRLAARHPNRVRALVLMSAWARLLRTDDYPIGVPVERIDSIAAAADPEAAVDDSDIDIMAPSIAGDPEARRWWMDAARRGAGPAIAKANWDVIRHGDVSEDLPAVRAPALVLHCVDNQLLPVAFGRWLAEHLPDARFVGLPGADHVIWAGPKDLALAEIEDFLTGRRIAAAAERTLTAILFTDIVDSTARNAAVGDSSWVERLAQHDAMVERQIGRYGGREVKSMGDGVLAVFPLASTAVAAARAIVAGALELEIDVRAAVHTGEVSSRNDDVLGMGVTIASRALAHAGGGEVVATSTVAEVLVGSGVTFAPIGAFVLKGVPGEWRLFRVSGGG